MLGQGRHVVVPVTAAENSAVDLWVERFESAVEHLREAGVGGDLVHFQAGTFQVLASAAAGVELDSRRSQSLGKFNQLRLIVDAEKRSFDFDRNHAERGFGGS